MTNKIDNALLPADDVEDMIELNRDAMQTAMQSYSEWFSSAYQVQSEVFGFIGDRVREDLEMPKRMADCASPGDIVQCQMAFAQKMLSDYADESLKLMGMMSNGKGGKVESDKRPV